MKTGFKVKQIPIYRIGNKIYLGLDGALNNLPKGITEINMIIDQKELMKTFDCKKEDMRTRLKTGKPTKEIKELKDILGDSFKKEEIKVPSNISFSDFVVKRAKKIFKKKIKKNKTKLRKSIKEMGVQKSAYIIPFRVLCFIFYLLKTILTIKDILIVQHSLCVAMRGGESKTKMVKKVLDKDGFIKVGKRRKKNLSQRAWDKVPVEKWTSNQIAQYIKHLYQKTYGIKSLEFDFGDSLGSHGGRKRGLLWGRLKHQLIQVFELRDFGLESVKEYLDWIFEIKKDAGDRPISLGFIVSPVLITEWMVSKQNESPDVETSDLWKE